jgi:DNA repair protein RadC
MNNSTQSAISAKRNQLREISQIAKEAVKMGFADSVNEAILDIYRGEGKGTTFATFNQWLAEGKRVKRGEKALLLWGKQVNKKKEEDEKGYEFFPVAYVFSDLQVEDLRTGATVEEITEKYGCKEIEVTYKKTDFAFDVAKINTSLEAYQVAKPFYSKIMDFQEMFGVILLNHSNKPIGFFKMSIGGINATVVDRRIIFETALKCHASQIIITHNHPSGNLKPSEPDKKITKAIIEAGVLLEIKVLDHIILSSDGFYSFGDNGMM